MLLELCKHLTLNTFFVTEKQTAPFPLSSSRGASTLSVLWKLNCCSLSSPNTLHSLYYFLFLEHSSLALWLAHHNSLPKNIWTAAPSWEGWCWVCQNKRDERKYKKKIISIFSRKIGVIGLVKVMGPKAYPVHIVHMHWATASAFRQCKT